MSRREKPSHIPLFPDSYLADTTHLTTEQHGAYFLLLMAAWRSNDCSLPHDEERLAKLAGLSVAKWRKVGPAVLEMWTCEGGRCWQKRLRHEWSYVREKRTKARAAIDSRWEREKGYGRSTDVIHQGGGEGVGTNHPYQEEGLVGNSHTREAGPFTVIRGGGQ